MPDTAAALPLLKHTQVLRDRLPLEGARIADIGCGDGGLVRAMARGGAWVVGIDPGPQQLARARAAEAAGAPENREAYVCALGEALPLPGACLDALVYFNALHHVPIAVQQAALAEAARVLRPGGLLYVQEPLAEGDYFELMRPIEDETEVRARAYEALQAAALDDLPQADETGGHEQDHDNLAHRVTFPDRAAGRHSLPRRSSSDRPRIRPAPNAAR